MPCLDCADSDEIKDEEKTCFFFIVAFKFILIFSVKITFPKNLIFLLVTSSTSFFSKVP